MSRYRVRSVVTVAPLTAADIGEKVALFSDPEVISNLHDVARAESTEQISGTFLGYIQSTECDRLEYTLRSTKKGNLLGFAWLEDLDWKARCGELSIALDPKFRFGVGSVCLAAMLDMAFNELNLEYLFTRIQAENHLMLNGDKKGDRFTLVQRNAMYTAGKTKDWLAWNESREECPLWAGNDRN